MKILFVWNVAGVASIHAKYLRQLGHTCTVISRTTQDIFKYLDFYGDEKVEENFDMRAIEMSAGYDVIVVSSLPHLAVAIKTLHPESKVLLEYHGSDLREAADTRGMANDYLVDKILVSTPDLLQFRPWAKWIPTPVDMEHFKESSHVPGAVFIKARYHEIPDVDFPYYLYDREIHPVTYAEMPKLLQEWDTYVDIKNYRGVGYLKAHSKTALEALATGMKVYSYERKYITGIPEEHIGMNSAKLLEATIREI